MTQVPFRSAAGLPAILQLPVGSLPVLEQRSEAELQLFHGADQADVGEPARTTAAQHQSHAATADLQCQRLQIAM